MTKQDWHTLSDLLSQPKKAVIIGHKNPDGDAVGASLGLFWFLKSQGHDPIVLMPNDFPDFLKWLPGCSDIVLYDREASRAERLLSQCEVIFTLDFNALNRTGDLGALLELQSQPFVMIDHHQQPDDYALVTYSDTSMSSTCEMVYHFIDQLGHKALITPEIATNLYTGIMTDTGSFKFPATTPRTHRAVADLIECGAIHHEIHNQIYDTQSPDRLKLLGQALSNLVLHPEFHLAYITLTQDELEACNFKKGDTEGFVNYALSIIGIKVAVIFIENKNEGIIKMSLRSKGRFSVNDFARHYFHGGGHTNAAGGKFDGTMEDATAYFMQQVPQHKNELDAS